MQITHQGFYTQKLAKATKKHLTRGSLRGQIYDASGQPLVENVDKKVLSFTRSNKFTAEEMRQTAQLLLNYVSVSNPQITKRQEVDFYLANTEVYKEVVDKLPKEERIDTMVTHFQKLKSTSMRWIVLTQLNWAIRMKKKRPSISSAK